MLSRTEELEILHRVREKIKLYRTEKIKSLIREYERRIDKDKAVLLGLELFLSERNMRNESK